RTCGYIALAPLYWIFLRHDIGLRNDIGVLRNDIGALRNDRGIVCAAYSRSRVAHGHPALPGIDPPKLRVARYTGARPRVPLCQRPPRRRRALRTPRRRRGVPLEIEKNQSTLPPL